MLVSFLIPTRKQTTLLRNCVGSIRRLASGRHNYEILLAVDRDDSETLAIIPEIKEFLPPNVLKVIITAPKGYARLHEYYNELAAISSGQLLALWNDDVVMLSKLWDSVLAQELAEGGRNPYLMWHPQEIHGVPGQSLIPGQFAILSGGFPIIHRDAYEAMGHFSQSPLNDRYLNDVMGSFAADGQDRSYLSRICIHHDNSHSTYSAIAIPLLPLHEEPGGEIEKHIMADREALSSKGLF